jgi:hypothetical protein
MESNLIVIEPIETIQAILIIYERTWLSMQK